MSAVDHEAYAPLAWRRTILPLCLLAGIVYIASLIATIPARIVLASAGDSGPLSSVSGTIWQGNALLADSTVLDWRGRPLSSLTRLSFVADWELRGAQTEIGGQATVGPGKIHLTSLRGRAGWPLVASFTDIGITCDMQAIIESGSLSLGTGSYAVTGSAGSPAGECRATPDAGPVSVPALSLVSMTQDDESQLTLSSTTNPDTVFLTASLTEAGALSVDLTEEGAALLPSGMPRGAMSLELEL